MGGLKGGWGDCWVDGGIDGWMGGLKGGWGD